MLEKGKREKDRVLDLGFQFSCKKERKEGKEYLLSANVFGIFIKFSSKERERE